MWQLILVLPFKSKQIHKTRTPNSLIIKSLPIDYECGRHCLPKAPDLTPSSVRSHVANIMLKWVKTEFLTLTTQL